MRARLRLFLAVALSVFVPSTPALATAQRTFVASTGNDAAPCSISSPVARSPRRSRKRAPAAK
jgi:hypothetical protein